MERRVMGRLSVAVECVFSTHSTATALDLDLDCEPVEVGWGVGRDRKSQFSEQIRHSQKFHPTWKTH